MAAKKGKKPMSPARVAAMKAVEVAKSEQEKTKARTELKQIRFQEIVVPRVKRTLKAIRMLGKMGKSSGYKWNAEQGQKIANAIAKESGEMVKVYTGIQSKPEDDFTL